MDQAKTSELYRVWLLARVIISDSSVRNLGQAARACGERFGWSAEEVEAVRKAAEVSMRFVYKKQKPGALLQAVDTLMARR